MSLPKKTPPVPQANLLQALWRRLARDPVVLTALVVLVGLYASVFLADFIAPYAEGWSRRGLANMPSTPIYLQTETGDWRWPYVFGVEKRFDPATLSTVFTPTTEAYPLRFFTPGSSYKLFGLIPGNIHLVQVDSPGVLSLLGSDLNGRDLFSRLLFGGQVSLTIGFISLLIAFPIGLLYGGLSGYVGGKLDGWLMRIAELVMSIPTLYLLLTLATLMPSSLSSSARFMLTAVILAAIGWAGLARVIRGQVLTIRELDFVEAARACGASHWRLLVHHVLPQTASYVVVSLTLAIPGTILMESGLSFLGLGIQQPDASWGNMLKEAENITNILYSPWMLMPGLLVFLAVLAFNVLGDAVRDALDPKQQRG